MAVCSPCAVALPSVGVEIVICLRDCSYAVVDLSNATDLKMLAKSPGGNTYAWNASLYTDGTDGCMKYVLQANDLTEVGVWEIGGYAKWGAADVHYTKDTGRIQAFQPIISV